MLALTGRTISVDLHAVIYLQGAQHAYRAWPLAWPSPPGQLASPSLSQVQTYAASAAACPAWDKLSGDVRWRLSQSAAVVAQLITRHPAAESYSASERRERTVGTTPDEDHPLGRHAAIGVQAGVPAMPEILPGTLWRSPNLLPVPGQRHTVGWQDTRKDGPCFVVARTGVMGDKVLDRFPLTQDGWSRAWAALVQLDAAAAAAVAKRLQDRRDAYAGQRAEGERQAQAYEAFAAAGDATVFRALGVQVMAEGSVYTIGYNIAAQKINTSRLLGPLPGAQAVVTDGAQAWSPGRAMFLPVGLAGLATKTKADAVIVFADGTFHSVALDGNNVVREAQKQAVQFNALAGASAPATSERESDPAVKLRKLQELRDAGLLTQDEYEAKRAEVISSI